MRTPKESFLVSGHAKNWGMIISQESFEVACEYALLQLQSQMMPTTIPGTSTDPYISIDANSQMWGARRVIQILSNLSIPETPPPKPKQDKLNYG